MSRFLQHRAVEERKESGILAGGGGVNLPWPGRELRQRRPLSGCSPRTTAV